MVVEYLERDYDKQELLVVEWPGMDNSWHPGLYRTYWGGEMRPLYSTHVQPLFTIKHDKYEEKYDFCGWCIRGIQHVCGDCDTPLPHMADEECEACWEASLKAIARRPPEEDEW